MKKKIKKIKPGAVSTLLGRGTTIEGVVRFDGIIRIDGAVRGKIFGESGTILIGETAVVDADVTVGRARIMGTVNGTVSAAEVIEVLSPGCVMGDMCAPTISISPGAVFNGKCGMRAETLFAEGRTDASGGEGGDGEVEADDTGENPGKNL